MKWFFRLSVGLLIYYIFRFFKHQFHTDPDPDSRKDKLIIRIIRSFLDTGKLELFDEHGRSAEKFTAWSGQKIKWEILDESGVKSIKQIILEGIDSVFKEKPKKLPGEKHWQGKLKKTNECIQECYNIEWKDVNDRPHPYDPLIQVKPL